MRPRLQLLGPFLLMLGLFVATGASLASDTVAEGKFDRTLNVSGPVDLEVHTGSGSISVRVGGSGSVHVVGIIRANASWRLDSRAAEQTVRTIEGKPPIEQNGNTIRIGRMEDEELRRNISISYELVVPAETKLRAHTGAGTQTIDGVHGPLEASTGSGSLRISNIGSEAHLSTGSGSIEVDRIQGSVRASTGSGHISGKGIAGGFTGHTGSGSVEVEHMAAGNDEIQTGSGTVTVRGARGSVRVRTGSGSITAEGEPTGDWQLHTASGNVRVRLPQQSAFELYARTSSGQIRTRHPLTVEGQLNKHEVRGKVRGGGRLVEVSTSSGSVEIE